MTATSPPAERIPLYQAAGMARVSANTITNWVRAGKLRGYRVGGRVFIDAADLIRVIEGTPIEPIAIAVKHAVVAIHEK